MIKVRMVPSLSDIDDRGEGGVHTVIRKWAKYLPEYGVELVDGDDFDIFAVHAGSAGTLPHGVPIVSHLHGIYFTGDYAARPHEYHANRRIIDTMRKSVEVTVPSEWVAEVFERDMHYTPSVLGHGIDYDEWQGGENKGYIVGYAKNRANIDVCDPTQATELARAMPEHQFVMTFCQGERPDNVTKTGQVPYERMKEIVKGAAIFVSPIKETFGIGILEAMAAGVPVLTCDRGNGPALVGDNECGYVYRDGSIEDMQQGIEYILENREVLSRNSRIKAKQYDWRSQVEYLATLYERALETWNRPPTVSVVIPVYNKRPEQLQATIDSVLDQTHRAYEVIVVNDGSQSELDEQYYQITSERDVLYLSKNNGGVATARNYGAAHASGRYLCFLDSDDRIAPDFLKVCVDALEEDPELKLAYTKLLAHSPDGTKAVSKWPGDWDFDRQLKKQNQVPTCNVMEREIFERLGGYRQRYAPQGAGAEDAELWTRFGAFGYKCKLVTSQPLFWYSLGQGNVSGNREYREPDWLGWHPWAKGIAPHPFASYATPHNGRAHNVYQYDEPIVSVIIPVSDKHLDVLVDALDSLEAQSYRFWEAIVVVDVERASHELSNKFNALYKAYPYVRWQFTSDGPRGAGHARNVGAKIARSDLLLFLDADDYLLPEALSAMIARWNSVQEAVYTDYYGQAYIEDTAKLNPGYRRRIVHRDGTKTVIHNSAEDFDCERAQKQPARPLYLWNTVTTLFPREWFEELGGFDEELSSWEDVDLWWRAAKAGMCFTRVKKPLLVYRFYSGARRQLGYETGADLLKRLDEKYEGLEIMGCGCSGQSNNTQTYRSVQRVLTDTQDRSIEGMNDTDMIMCEYMHSNRGQHRVVGNGGGQRTDYGYRKGGDRFLVHRKDIAAQPHLFRPIKVEPRAVAAAPARQQRPAPPKPIDKPPQQHEAEREKGPRTPVPVKEDAAFVVKAEDEHREDLNREFSLRSIVSDRITERLHEAGIWSATDVMRNAQNLSSIKGIGPARAEELVREAKKFLATTK